MGRTVSQVANQNANYATEVVTVNSATGFDKGDLVYNVDGAIRTIPDNLVSTGTFNITAQQGTAFGGVAQSYTQLVEGNNIATLYGEPAAKLSNGNVVVVWLQGSYTGRSTYNIYFKITDINNNEVVVPTVVSNSTPSGTRDYTQVTVVALSGGGFAIGWRNSNNRLMTAVYDNSGTQTSAPLEATTTAMSGSYFGFSSTPLTNGGFAIAYWAITTSQATIQIYSSTGAYVATYTYTAATLAPSNAQQIGLASRLNGAVHELCFACNSTASLWGIGIINASTGASINTYTVNHAGGDFGIQVITNSTDNEFVIINSNANNVAYNRINASNTLSSSTTIQGSPITTGGAIFAKALSTGGFALAVPQDIISGAVGSPSVIVYNGTYVRQSTTNANIRGIQILYYPGVSMIESSGVLYLYQPPITHSTRSNSSNYNNTTYYGYLFRYAFSLTSLQQVPITNLITNTVGSVSGVNVSGYLKSSSTPSNAAFAAASTSAQTATFTQTDNTTNFAIAQTTVASVTADSIDSDTLANGNLVMVYRNRSNFSINYAIYNSLGIQVSSGIVAPTSGNTSSGLSAFVAALPNGKFVVMWYSDGSTLSYKIYSSSYSELATGVLPLTGLVPSNTSQRPAIAAGANNTFAVAYIGTSDYARYAIFNDTGTLLADAAVNSAISFSPYITGCIDGSFAMAAARGSATYVFRIQKTGATSYTSIGTYVNGSGAPYYTYSNAIICAPDGCIYSPYWSSSTVMVYVGTTYFPTGNIASVSVASANNVGYLSISTTGSGLVVGFNQNNNTIYMFNGTSTPTSRGITLNSYNTGNGSLTSVTPGFDNDMYVVMLNSSQNPTVAAINAYTQSYTSTITGGTTPSLPVALSPLTNKVALLGVSITPCTAGGTGIVQTNGNAELNSNYPASTASQTFDFKVIPGVDGAKGSISGRNVTITKG